ncbi:hypothetical protein [uncultured Aureimonas sp.]|uniref:hypothetical protein n=1 Tax=uncultured Aureimonas sp. TaxID=1604662 RepID=UPI0025E34F10|nr:hypothetical protein [uncultured Aureimonas sp.]
MHRTLADLLAGLTSISAFVMIVVAMAFGYATMDIPGLIMGLLGGLVVAAVMCGTISLLVLIERHLRELAEGIRPEAARSAPVSRARMDSAAGRIEPALR